MQPIDVDKKYHFFNPRAGIHYTLADRHNFYASFAVRTEEGSRAVTSPTVICSPATTPISSEKLYDYELARCDLATENSAQA